MSNTYIIVQSNQRGSQGEKGDTGNLTAAPNAVANVLRFVAGTPLPTSDQVRFHASELITSHAHYGFCDDSIIEYGQVGFQAHASYDDNARFNGTQDSDHHHSFQSYPHYNCTGKLNRMSGFWMQPDVTDGTITELSEFRASDPSGTGVITNLYGMYIAALTRGSANYAIYTEGNTPSKFGGSVITRNVRAVYSPTNDIACIIDATPTRCSIAASYDTNGSFVPLKFFTSDVERISIATNGVVTLEVVPVYASNAAAITGGLVVGDIYKTSTGQLMIVY